MLLPLLLTTIASAAQLPPQLFEALGEPGELRISYFGEEPAGSSIQLNAWNGFFDSGSFVARDASPAPDEERPFIPRRFESLEARQQGGDARWHVWMPAAGTLEVSAFLGVSQAKAGSVWRIQCGESAFERTARISDGSTAQPWGVRLSLAAGRNVIRMMAADPKAAAGTQIHRLELTGDGIRGARLLRARWRPAAVHTAYASSSCDASTLWVFETKSLTPAPSYSPINTPFGYFGTTFNPARTEPRGINFSMWAASKGGAAPPLTAMPHLLATGSPGAEFSGFGHEGSGVKLRGWDCLDWNPKSVIQALRIERRGERDYFYGYFYHGPQQRWVLHAAGARPPRRAGRPAAFHSVTAFCEIPGPPERQRSGDVERRIARRGWFLGEGGEWHVADVHSCNDRQTVSSRRIGASVDGWHVSIAGGMEIIDGPRTQALEPPASAAHASPLPACLLPGKVEGLFELPVEFRSHSARRRSPTSATVQYELAGLGQDASASLYYGPVDCLTFVARELHGTEKGSGAKLSAELYAEGRTWASSTEPVPTQDGVQRFELRDLVPGTTYFYRAFVSHADGKSWSFDTGSFTTGS